MVLRKSIVAFLCLFCFNLLLSNVYAQKQYLEITNLKNNRTKKIKEKKKITVYTKDQKIKGKLLIIDAETVSIKGKEIKLSEIRAIKNKSIIAKLASIVGIPIGSLIAIGSFGVTHDSPDSELLTTGILITSIGLISTQIKKKYKSERYKFKIVYD